MQVKSVLAFDVDGTLTERNTYQILPEGLSTLLNTLSQKGHFCILVTGKPASYATRILETNNLIDRGVIAENAGVYRRPKEKLITIYEKNSVAIMYALREFIGLMKSGGGLRSLSFEGKQHLIPVDPEDISILTLFTIPEFISHRWIFTQTISTEKVFDYLKETIIKNNWSNDLIVLPPFPDGGVQVIRKSSTGQIIDKSLLPEIVKIMYDLNELPPIAMFGDGHNDIPAMTPKEIIPLTFSNGHPEVIKFIKEKGGFISNYRAPDGLGIIEGLYWLSQRNFFQHDSLYVKKLLSNRYPSLQF